MGLVPAGTPGTSQLTLARAPLAWLTGGRKPGLVRGRRPPNGKDPAPVVMDIEVRPVSRAGSTSQRWRTNAERALTLVFPNLPSTERRLDLRSTLNASRLINHRRLAECRY
ncbi:hypothetical protein HPB52_013292 [Rhipicephalus sanguineus]|uniref:Uncharacterized protein n=1 Tax=Rhipicephalus sanguineus TaxID=34632 RepID=A0A9D4SWA2_RHISA|nr:hypothetical protein HPB52_013292 [Rhipicephalus sanguineus]